MVRHTFRCRQTKLDMNICLQFVGISINVADRFVFAGTNWESPVPESGIRILTVYLCSY